MKESGTIFVRMDLKRKQEAEEILRSLGITPSAAINMLYAQTILRRTFPVELVTVDHEAASTRHQECSDEETTNNSGTTEQDHIQPVTNTTDRTSDEDSPAQEGVAHQQPEALNTDNDNISQSEEVTDMGDTAEAGSVDNTTEEQSIETDIDQQDEQPADAEDPVEEQHIEADIAPQSELSTDTIDTIEAESSDADIVQQVEEPTGIGDTAEADNVVNTVEEDPTETQEEQTDTIPLKSSTGEYETGTDTATKDDDKRQTNRVSATKRKRAIQPVEGQLSFF